MAGLGTAMTRSVPTYSHAHKSLVLNPLHLHIFVEEKIGIRSRGNKHLNEMVSHFERAFEGAILACFVASRAYAYHG